MMSRLEWSVNCKGISIQVRFFPVSDKLADSKLQWYQCSSSEQTSLFYCIDCETLWCLKENIVFVVGHQVNLCDC